jgi:hypothetical protein
VSIRASRADTYKDSNSSGMHTSFLPTNRELSRHLRGYFMMLLWVRPTAIEYPFVDSPMPRP